MREEGKKDSSVYAKIAPPVVAAVMVLFCVQQFVHSDVLATIGGVITLAYLLVFLITIFVGVARKRWSKKLLIGLAIVALAGAVLGMIIKASDTSIHVLTALAGIAILSMSVTLSVRYIFQCRENEEFRRELTSWPGILIPSLGVLFMVTTIIVPIREKALMPFSLGIYYGSSFVLAFLLIACVTRLEDITEQKKLSPEKQKVF